MWIDGSLKLLHDVQEVFAGVLQLVAVGQLGYLWKHYSQDTS